MLRRVARVLGVLAIPLGLVALAVLVAPSSAWSSRAYAAGLAAIIGGLVTATRARRPGISRAGVALMAATALVRMASASEGKTLAMTTTTGGSARLLGRIFDEADVAFWGARLAFAAGAFKDPDVPEVPDALRRAYAEMRDAEGDAPSPVLPTYVGLEAAGHADLVVVEAVGAPRGALLFLHGFGGSFALPCWQLAQSAAAAGLVTYCPSVGVAGDWWTADGERTVRDTVSLIHARGLRTIYLMGLSNGARGAAILASRMSGTFRGIVLVSGAAPDAGPAGVPVLLLQGRRDAIFPDTYARDYAASHDSTTYVELDAGHFAMLLRRDEVSHALRGFFALSR